MVLSGLLADLLFVIATASGITTLMSGLAAARALARRVESSEVGETVASGAAVGAIFGLFFATLVVIIGVTSP